MASAPGAVLILVCPTCGKKYRGNPEKPDGRYQCPDDQATLMKFVPPGVVAQPAPATQEPPSPPEFNVSGHTGQESSDTHRDFVATTRIDSPLPGYVGGRDPLLASAHDDLAPDEIARRAADSLHEHAGKSELVGNDQTVFAESETVAAPSSTVPTPIPTPTPYAGIPTPPPMAAPDAATVVA